MVRSETKIHPYYGQPMIQTIVQILTLVFVYVWSVDTRRFGWGGRGQILVRRYVCLCRIGKVTSRTLLPLSTPPPSSPPPKEQEVPICLARQPGSFVWRARRTYVRTSSSLRGTAIGENLPLRNVIPNSGDIRMGT